MVVKQISIFIENTEGRIKKAINSISSKGINIRALSVADGSKFGILRLIVTDNKKSKELLEKEGFIVRETEVIVIGIPDKPNGLNELLETLETEKINLEYIYAFANNKTDEAVVVIKVEDYEKAKKLLESKNAHLFDEEDIENL
ncbi:MAG: acetolactate synthase [Methanobrevibacter wolinii]|uniref:acetolactate synthase n=1 Tax=Methanobrevibacter wolinii TaxID=190977 RepID=UPI0005B2AC94|nr:acetolactate synthase [Methanobrevibacter wolinii]MDD5959192.1 acetolactate synthase [Methanobrevibacter wolinii]